MSIESGRPRRTTERTPKGDQPLSVRLSTDERALVTTIAEYQGKTVSGFMRDAAIGGANKIIAEVGPDEMIRTIDERQRLERDASLEAARNAMSNLDKKVSPQE
jgi:uncharacterized protein (DUF1778 family)